MMTVITTLTLREGLEPEWDAAMRTRLDSAGGRMGFLGNQLLVPLDGLNRRVVVGTWNTRSDWEAWHNDAAFLASRQLLDRLQEGPGDTAWFEVIERQAAAGLGHAAHAVANRVREMVNTLAGENETAKKHQ